MTLPPQPSSTDVHKYEAFGLTISAPFACPELVPSDGQPDVHIRHGAVPDGLVDPVARGVRFQATRDRFWLKVDGVAKLLVVGGREITIDRELDSTDDDVRVFLFGSAFGALLHQRGLLPFHASAIEVNGSAVAFLGPSGVGKSTLAAALARRGYRVMADDVAAISVEASRVLLVPGYPQLKVWADAVEKLGEDKSALRQVRANLEKYGIPLQEQYCRERTPLGRIYVLESKNNGSLELTEIRGTEKLTALVGNTYRLHFLGSGAGRAPNFEQCAAVAARTVVMRLRRPTRPFLLEDLADLAEQDILR